VLDSLHVNDWLLIIRRGGLTCTCWSFVATCANDAITDLSSSSSSLSSCLKFSIICKNKLVSCVVRSDSLRFLAIVLRLSSVVGGKLVVTKKGVKSVTVTSTAADLAVTLISFARRPQIRALQSSTCLRNQCSHRSSQFSSSIFVLRINLGPTDARTNHTYVAKLDI